MENLSGCPVFIQHMGIAFHAKVLRAKLLREKLFGGQQKHVTHPTIP